MPLKLSPSQIAFNARGDGSFKLPFQEQIAFFRQKLNLPTEHFDDILKAGHDRAFVVAGAAKADLLSDLQAALDQAIKDGKSIEWFRDNFSAIVKKHGWEGWTGSGTAAGRDWRTRIIYRTNVMSSYAAGRYAQLTNPALLKIAPYWKYVHNDTVAHPRPLHVGWSGLVLKHDDPFWATHFPPNGWGCRCRVTAVTAREFKGDTAPPETYWTKKDRWGNTHNVPTGIDYGWDYAPGAGLSPKILAKETMDAWKSAKADAWEMLSKRSWASYNRSAEIPLDKTNTKLGVKLSTSTEVVDALKIALGAESKVFDVGEDFNYPVLVDAEVLGQHLDVARSIYLPYLTELLTNPFEIWAMFQRHKGTGKVEMRVRIIKRIDTGEKEGLLLVAQASKGILEAYTFITVPNLNYLNKQREGILVYGR